MSVDKRVFRSYDIRALVPDLVDESSVYFGKVYDPDSFQAPLEPVGVREIGRGLAVLFDAPKVVVGADTRLSSPAWKAALIEGFNMQGVDVIDLGLTSTDTVYFASGTLDLPGVQITASHCTKELNGMKMVRAGAKVIGKGSGMEELADIVLSGAFPASNRVGTNESLNILPQYVDHLMTFIDVDAIKPFKIVGDAGNGVGGVLAEMIADRIPQITLDKMYFEPDGSFPNHEANPFEVENIHEIIARIPAEGFDFGVAWDGDADRVYFLDEKGGFIAGDFITALISRYFLEQSPGAAIVYDVRSSWAVAEWVSKLGGIPIMERVGHSYIKRTMREHNAVFGGEVSGHYYFREHYFADNGYIPFLAILTVLSKANMPMSELIANLGEYFVSGEINSEVEDKDAAIARIKAKYADARISEMDGVSIDYPDWHCNVRPSANDPVIRLNLEARSADLMDQKRDEVLGLIRA